MNINHNTQLGLRFRDQAVKRRFAEAMVQHLDDSIKKHETATKVLTMRQQEGLELQNRYERGEVSDEAAESALMELGRFLPINTKREETEIKIGRLFGNNPAEMNEMFGDDTKYFYICNSVYRAADTIRISDSFTGRILKDVSDGTYTYLLGPYSMARFTKRGTVIRGFFFEDHDRIIAFDFGVDTDEGGMYYPEEFNSTFSQIMQVLTFIELGDTETVYLESGRNNGKTKKTGKITNTSTDPIHIVDSTWNKIIIRTDGFAVRGHFRLQPCGEANKDRKLIWIDAFEKHGYVRNAKNLN